MLAMSIRPSLLRAKTLAIASTPGDAPSLMSVEGVCATMENVGLLAMGRIQRTVPVARSIAVALSLACTKTEPPDSSTGLTMPPAAPDTSTLHSCAPCAVS